MECKRCNKVFNSSELVTARNAKGIRSTGAKANKYCLPCEEEVYQRAVLKDIFDNRFMQLGYYRKSDKTIRNKYLGLISTLLSKLESDNYTPTQIRLILEYMIDKKNIEFDENILLLVPYNFSEVRKYHNELYRIATSKTYGYIEPEEEVLKVRPPHRPNRKAIKITNMDLI